MDRRDASTSTDDTSVELTEVISAPGGSFAGDVLRLGDIAACLSAERFASKACVTVAVDECVFGVGHLEPNTTVVIHARVNRAWNTSLEVGVTVYSERIVAGALSRERICSAFFSFVCLDGHGVRSKLPSFVPSHVDPEAWRRFAQAEERRSIRLARKELLQGFSLSQSSDVNPNRSRTFSLGSKSAPAVCEKTVLVLVQFLLFSLVVEY